jgi:hypothetical protein
MADKQQIAEALGRSGWAYDTGHFEILAANFTADAVFDLSIAGMGRVGSFVGRDAILKLHTDAYAAQKDQRRHAITNIFFTDETERSVTAHSYLILLVIKDGTLTVTSSGAQTDKFVLEDGAWRIAHRQLDLDRPY